MRRCRIYGHIKGRVSHDVIEQALGILRNLDHPRRRGCRSPCAATAPGILIQIPDAFTVRKWPGSRWSCLRPGITASA